MFLWRHCCSGVVACLFLLAILEVAPSRKNTCHAFHVAVPPGKTLRRHAPPITPTASLPRAIITAATHLPELAAVIQRHPVAARRIAKFSAAGVGASAAVGSFVLLSRAFHEKRKTSGDILCHACLEDLNNRRNVIKAFHETKATLPFFSRYKSTLFLRLCCTLFSSKTVRETSVSARGIQVFKELTFDHIKLSKEETAKLFQVILHRLQNRNTALRALVFADLLLDGEEQLKEKYLFTRLALSPLGVDSHDEALQEIKKYRVSLYFDEVSRAFDTHAPSPPQLDYAVPPFYNTPEEQEDAVTQSISKHTEASQWWQNEAPLLTLPLAYTFLGIAKDTAEMMRKQYCDHWAKNEEQQSKEAGEVVEIGEDPKKKNLVEQFGSSLPFLDKVSDRFVPPMEEKGHEELQTSLQNTMADALKAKKMAMKDATKNEVKEDESEEVVEKEDWMKAQLRNEPIYAALSRDAIAEGERFLRGDPIPEEIAEKRQEALQYRLRNFFTRSIHEEQWKLLKEEMSHLERERENEEKTVSAQTSGDEETKKEEDYGGNDLRKRLMRDHEELQFDLGDAIVDDMTRESLEDLAQQQREVERALSKDPVIESNETSTIDDFSEFEVESILQTLS